MKLSMPLTVCQVFIPDSQHASPISKSDTVVGIMSRLGQFGEIGGKYAIPMRGQAFS